MTGSSSPAAPVLQPAADTSQFNPGNIITDDVFFARQAMSAAEIEAFIRVKGSSCVTGNDGTPCLKDFRQDTTARAADSYCSGYGPAAQESAGVIIAKVAMACGVSPRVLLVLLQKEQGLVTSTGRANLSASRYTKATGFACPDTAACDTQYAGFQNQVYMAARQYRVYAANPTKYAYRAGRTVNVLYSPNAACGSAPVAIANQATAGLYIYTPYQPNGAALGAGYGSGDGCSAYGNRNFWLYFTDWFGSTQYDAATATLPRGTLDGVTSSYGQLTVGGWTFDPDDPSVSLLVHVYVDGKPVLATTADRTRADVGAVYPAAGAAHGYTVTFPADLGVHSVCAYAINIGAGAINPQLGCFTADNQDAGMPKGSVDAATAVPGAINVAGWAFDPDTPAATVTVRAYVDGIWAKDIPATDSRPDVGAAYGSGSQHGYVSSVPVTPGVRTICLYALNVGLGTHHTGLACNTLTVPDPAAYNPFGSFDVGTGQGGTAVVAGWAVDPDALPTPVAMTLTVDGNPIRLTAGDIRPDIAAVVPGAGPTHGYSWSGVLPAGQHQLCVTAVNVGYGTGDAAFGCRTVTTVDGLAAAPQGSYDVATGGLGTLTVAGWTFDPDAPTAPVTVHMYVDGSFATAFTAGATRPDVGRAVPGVGDAHGIDWTGPLAAGRHQVCLYAMNVGAGVTRELGCRDVTVADPSNPIGTLDDVSVAGNVVSATGWAVDRDVLAQSLIVHVYVDGVGYAVTGDRSRPDVAGAFPGAGDLHGYLWSGTLSAGQHQVCSYAINVGPGTVNTQLGCRTVTVR